MIEDSKDIKELIKQVIKVDNRIYQSKRVKRELGRLPQVYKSQTLKQAQWLWYGVELMDLSTTKELQRK